MGLWITGKGSKKEYSRSYFALHLVRWLALRICGLNEKIAGKTSFSYLNDAYINKDAIPTPDEMLNLVWANRVAGHFYPNLLFHSDCEGSYTKKGAVLKNENLLTGNSIGLLKELKKLKREKPKKISMDDERAWDTFNTLYELVKDEVENGEGILNFH